MVIDSQVKQIRTNKIGFYTNVSSTLYTLLSNFEEGTPEHTAILNRLKYGRVLQGLAIDSAKGLVTDPYPEYWSKWKRVKDDMSDEEKERTIFNNRIVADKRPYFMRWLYSHYNKIWLDEIAKFDNISWARWETPFLELLENKDSLTDEKRNLVDRYERRSFFITNNSTMNRITKHVEKYLKNMQKVRRAREPFNYEVLLSDGFRKPTKDEIDKMALLYKEYKSLKKVLSFNHSDNSSGVDSIEGIGKYMNQKAYSSISSNSADLADIAIYTCYNFLGANSKSFMWTVFGKELIDNIKSKRKERTVRVPMKNDKGSMKYLWESFGNYLLDIDEE